MSGVVNEIFGENGLLSRAYTGYKARAGQIELVRAIMGKVERGGAVLGEAPCGCGKSYSGLVPLIVEARSNRAKEGKEAQRREVVREVREAAYVDDSWEYGDDQWSGKDEAPGDDDPVAHRPSLYLTKTIALQEQIVKKDLPFLSKTLGSHFPFSYALLKGRNNYVCRAATDGVEDGESRRFDDVPDDVLGWVSETATGDRSECPVPISDDVWRKLSRTSDECDGRLCEFYTTCFFRAAKEEAMQSDIVVANYHVALVGDAMLLHACRHVICDEAHELANVARQVFGWTLTKFAVHKIADLVSDGIAADLLLDGVDVPSPSALRTAGDKVFMSLLAMMEEAGSQTLRLRQAGLVGSKWLREALGQVVKAVESLPEKRPASWAQAHRKLRADMNRLWKSANRVLGNLTQVDSTLPDGWVFWLEQRTSWNEPHAVIEARPFLVDKILRYHLFGRCVGEGLGDDESVTPTQGLGACDCVCAMSATLRSCDGFGFIRREIGAPEDAQELAVESPFCLAKQAALVVPDYVPLPPKFMREKNDDTRAESDKYEDRVAVAAAELIRAMGGRTLCLFTSWAALDRAYTKITEFQSLGKLADSICVLRQEPGQPVQPLVASFATDETSVLMGVRSLWEGVDVPGDSLKGLFINKIPFPVPGEPINEAMSEWIDRTYPRVNGRGLSFDLWSLPLATTLVQQGMGRLVRSETDTGVIVIADQRLNKYAYGRRILAALPRFSRLGSLDIARRLFPGIFQLTA